MAKKVEARDLNSLVRRGIPVRIRSGAPHGLVRELAYLADLESVICGFDSHPGYHLLCRLMARTADFESVNLCSNHSEEAKSFFVVQFGRIPVSETDDLRSSRSEEAIYHHSSEGRADA